MPASNHSVFTGWLLLLLPKQQHQSTEGTNTEGTSENWHQKVLPSYGLVTTWN